MDNPQTPQGKGTIQQAAVLTIPWRCIPSTGEPSTGGMAAGDTRELRTSARPRDSTGATMGHAKGVLDLTDLDGPLAASYVPGRTITALLIPDEALVDHLLACTAAFYGQQTQQAAVGQTAGEPLTTGAGKQPIRAGGGP